MIERTVTNPVSGEKATFVETSRETGGARTVIDFEVAPGGGVTNHRHADHREEIEVLEGVIEVRAGGVTRRYGPGERAVIEPGTAHDWRNVSPGPLRFRGGFWPGNPGFEAFFRVWCGMGRDGALRPSGMPRRLADMAVLVELDPSIASGALRVVAPLLRWTARRDRTAALLRRYGGDDRVAA